MKKIILLGSPGAGKGASGQRLSERLGIPHINTGDLIREEIKKNTEKGKKFEKLINKGNFINDMEISELLKKRLSEEDCSRGFILDGFPRNLKQAKILGELKLGPFVVINLVLSDDEIIKRLGARRICKRCKRVYNLITIPSQKRGICDFCGGEGLLIQREDDKPEVIKKRLKIYKKEISPLIDYYTERGNIFDVPTLPGIEEVVEDILDVLEMYAY